MVEVQMGKLFPHEEVAAEVPAAKAAGIHHTDHLLDQEAQAR